MAYLGYQLPFCTVDMRKICNMSVSNPLVTAIHNGTTFVNMVSFCRMGACVF